MIKSIRLENFQSHKNTTINFCDGVNAIVGLSDSGKTAILRALRWVVTNKPTGDAFQSYWGGDTEVCVELGDGTKVTRKRTKSDNLYVLDNTEFRAFGQDVPEEIRRAFDINDINLQAQMDGPFLLAQSPGEVAQILNKVVNLDVIDTAISSIRKQKLRADGDLKSEEARLDRLHEDVEKFDYLDDLESKISHVESLDAQLAATRTRLAGIRGLVGQISQYEQRVYGAGLVLRAEGLLDKVMSGSARLSEVRLQATRLNDLLDNVDAHEKKVVGLNRLLEAEPVFGSALAKAIKLSEICAEGRRLDLLVKDVQTKQQLVDSLSATIEKDEAEFHKLMPEQCPLCGQEVN